MNILSLFDGISCGRVALDRANIHVDRYVASEIDKNAIRISQQNYPDVVRMGDICSLHASPDEYDLVMGGSPCQSFSKTVSSNTGFDGKSKLFFEFVRILKETKPRYFLLENVVMKKEWEDVITEHLGVKPIRIDSSHFSAQTRARLYWTNISILPLPSRCPNVLGDILEADVPEKYFYSEPFETINADAVEAILHINGHDILKRVNSKAHKCQTLTAVCGGNQQKKVIDRTRARKLTPLEYERLQTLPDGYTAGFPDGIRYKTIGNGWTVNVIAHILRGIPCS